MHTKTLTQLSQDLINGDTTSESICQHYIQRLKQYSDLNTLVTLSEEHAMQQALAADQARATGKSLSALQGLPIVLKDLFCTKDIKTSCGSKVLDNFIAPYDATVTEKLNDAGAVMLGKANMDEFAMGSGNENSYYGAVKNPWDITRVPGGSSGGSAALVAARLAPASIGTDTGGSVRQPAAFCGVTGLKPTYGRISRYGMVAYASSFDQAGPIAQTAEDCALLMNAMAGFDERDSTSSQHPTDDYCLGLNTPLAGKKIGVPKEYFSAGLDSQIADNVQRGIDQLVALGAEAVEISLPFQQHGVSAYYMLAPAEASSNLQRFDGVRYGYRCEDPANLEDLYKRSRSESFGAEVQRRILVGTFALSAGYQDAYYTKAQKVRRMIRNEYQEAFQSVDFIAGPTTPTTAFKLGVETDPVTMYLNDIYTITANLAGLPSLSMPCGFVDGLPVGLQLTANYFQESLLLNACHQYQQMTDWHQQIPAAYRD